LRDALKADPRIAANNVEVSVLDRDITLTGSVNSIGAKAAAEEDAKNVSGAGLVYSYLTVSPSGEVTESALKTALDAIFDSDSLLQGADLTAEVSGGVVEVHGKVLNSFQRRRAIVTAAHAAGVERVINKIRVDWDSGSVAPETAAIQ
ncbi:MAG: BON domain-containing protein, partial [Verrucomicrobiales bacterium]|nr:BON domain-containing protein [Verrucomicrobiales bacterium]